MAAPPSITPPHDLCHPLYVAGGEGIPSFITRRTDGVFVSGAFGEGRLLRFVEAVFADGAFFSGLDFPNFNRLLFGVDQGAAPPIPVRLAADVLIFTPARRTLYRAVQASVEGTSADYLFETVYLESLDDVVVDAAGAKKKVPPPSAAVKLDFDEFIAHLWVNGVRAGVDESQVRQIIAKGGVASRLRVARWIEPVPGKNAGIEEKSKLLRRDHTPRVLRGGGVDLGMYQNHFPQVEKGELLVRKTPRVLGVPGRRINGDIIEPEIPTDFDFTRLAGAGTRVEERPEGQFIVAAMTGFVSIDKASNQFSIAAKIVNRAGVSMRTTGDLQLAGEDYEEFGEIQERRAVEGKNITIHADVYGSIVSRGGVVVLDKNLMKGKVINPGGETNIRGLASAATIEGCGATVRVHRAEGCIISGGHIIIEVATKCQLIGKRVEVGTATGCTIIAQVVKLDVSKDYRHEGTSVTMLVPNQAANEKKQAEARKRMAEITTKLENTMDAQEALKGQQGFGNYLLLKDKLSRGEIQLTPAQQDNLFKIESRMSMLMQQYRVMSAAIDDLQRAHVESDLHLRALLEEASTVGGDVECAIKAVTGDTIVRTMIMETSMEALAGDALHALIAKVRGLIAGKDALFTGSAGKVAWRYKDRLKAAKG